MDLSSIRSISKTGKQGERLYLELE